MPQSFFLISILIWLEQQTHIKNKQINIMNALRSKLTSQLIINKRTVLKSMALSTMMTATTSVTMTLCEGGKENKNDDNNNNNDKMAKIIAIASNTNNLDLDSLGQMLGSNVQDAIDSGIPTQISYGFLCGYSSGYALKKVGKVASVIFGLGFVTLQSLSYAGYLTIDHGALKKDVEKALDLNKDGVVDDKDAAVAYNKLMDVLQFNMTGGSGFAAGFLGGMRSG
jgi:uncharacterized membrane protein (Fun14 family)